MLIFYIAFCYEITPVTQRDSTVEKVCDISEKGRSRISMVWVPPLGFHPYSGGKSISLQNKLTPNINAKKKIFTKVMNKFWKIKK